MLSKHQLSSVHKQALLYWKDFETVTPVNFQLVKQAAHQACELKKHQEKNRQILFRIIDIVMILVKTGHPLRGHREHSESHNRGIFLEISGLVAEYDHFHNSPRNALYVSNIIQNELIAAI